MSIIPHELHTMATRVPASRIPPTVAIQVGTMRGSPYLLFDPMRRT